MKTRRSIREIDEEADKENICPFPKQQLPPQAVAKQQCNNVVVLRERTKEEQQYEPGNRSPIKLLFKRVNNESYSVLHLKNDDLNTSNSSTNSANSYQSRLRASIREKAKSPMSIIESASSINKPATKKALSSNARKVPGRPKKAVTIATTKLVADLVTSQNIESYNLDAAEYNVLVEKARMSEIRVRLNRSNLRVALVEAHTSIVRSIAQLDLHLFQYKTAPCIYCPQCVRYMSIEQFARHVHDEDEVDKQSNTKTTKLNMVPCPDDINGDLSPQQIKLWNMFLTRVSRFNVFPSQPKSQNDQQNEPQLNGSELNGKNQSFNETMANHTTSSWDREAITKELIKRGFKPDEITWIKF